MDEEWRIIEGFPNYRIGNMGNIQSRYAGKRRVIGDWHPLEGYIARNGYKNVTLCHEGRKRIADIHVLVLESFVGPRPRGMVGCHGNGIPTDCRLSNLRWDTYKANEQDKRQHGTYQGGEHHHKAKLTAKEVAHIKRLLLLGEATQRQIGEQFGVTGGAVGKIERGQTWINVDAASYLHETEGV